LALYVYLRTAAVFLCLSRIVGIIRLLYNNNNNISAKSKMTSLPALNTQNGYSDAEPATLSAADVGSQNVDR